MFKTLFVFQTIFKRQHKYHDPVARNTLLVLHPPVWETIGKDHQISFCPFNASKVSFQNLLMARNPFPRLKKMRKRRTFKTENHRQPHTQTESRHANLIKYLFRAGCRPKPVVRVKAYHVWHSDDRDWAHTTIANGGTIWPEICLLVGLRCHKQARMLGRSLVVRMHVGFVEWQWDDRRDIHVGFVKRILKDAFVLDPCFNLRLSLMHRCLAVAHIVWRHREYMAESVDAICNIGGSTWPDTTIQCSKDKPHCSFEQNYVENCFEHLS